MPDKIDPAKKVPVRPNGAAIRAARVAKGWSRLKLANLAGIKERTVEKVEGEATEPKVRVQLATVEALAKALGVQVMDAGSLLNQPEEDVTKQPGYGRSGEGIEEVYPQLSRTEIEKVLNATTGPVVIVNT